MVLQKTQREIGKEIKKLIWMKQEFIKECKRMLDLIDKQELKIYKIKEIKK